MQFRIPGQYLLANGLGFFTAIIIAVVAIVGGDRSDPIPVIEQKIIPDVVEINKTQTINLHWKRLVLRRCDSITTGRLTDSRGVLHYYAPVHIEFTELDEKNLKKIVDYSREMILPEGIAAGQVRLDVNVDFICNWTNKFWAISVKRNPTFFEVKR